ncbi:LAETG motif-containing sortase-dependent surface protein [Streptomyces sp. NBC_01353]|uniref:LAETG motif-containing sortase-dependent surface protein n=1 Tax=Streptomyces sp. NBC_01353 TaxID=2903835 RepID=UPI002E324B27|nr:LAETG motif-containing sortase-dependent surface protein [Streptomyces sp. NBC_01353]
MLAFSGLSPLAGEAVAAPKQVRCDDKYNLRGKNIKPATDFPGDASRIKAKWDAYKFPNQRHAMDGLKLPTDIAQQKAFLAKLDKPYKEYKEGTPERVYATYKNYMEGKNWNDQKYGSFDNWLNDAYIELEARRTRGDAFEAKVVEDLGLVGPDWLCQEYVEYERDANGKPLYRKYDAVNYKRGIFVEMKSGGDNDGGQTPKDRKLLTSTKYKDFKIRFAFGEAVSDDTTNRIKNMNLKIGPDASGNNRVTGYAHHATATPDYKTGKWTKPGQIMTPTPGQTPASPGTDNINRSQPTPNDARRQQERANAANRNGSGVKGPGGVDFTTLDLRYVGKPVKGKGLDYSFSAKEVTGDQPGWGGQEKAQLISDSFFTWMALTPEKFWVNLNPDEPDRVMDKQFGKTDAGRVLLQADLEMKHDYAKLLDPREGLGKQYQDAMREAGVPCGTVTRNWIVPKTAKVRVDEGGLYILDAPLKVNSEASDVETPDPNGVECKLTPEQRKTSESLINRIIIPEVERRVNNAPNYADLRRVYTARVAAEYIRQQDQATSTDFRSIINSNDVAKWPLRGANKSWTPKQTFDDYVKSFTKGDYSFPCEVNGQNKICVMGGVDFSKAPKRNVSRVEFTTEHRHLPRTTKTSTQAMTDDAESDDTLFLGGNTKHTGGGDGGTDPKPTPTPTDDPKPTDQPSTPAPSTSTPGGPKPTGGAQDPHGDLADTGSSAPTGLIAGLAALLVALGGGLVWWLKRRKATA